MKYIKIDSNTFIQFNGETQQSVTLNKGELENQVTEIEKRLKNAIIPTDEELLAWAKENYPFVDHSAEQIELERIQGILDQLK